MKNINEKIGSLKKANLEKDLKKNYQLALKNEMFAKLVKKLKAKNLESYTSEIEDCSIENINCTQCESIHECKNEIIGHAYTPLMVDQRLEFAYNPCRYSKKINKENSYLDYVFFFNMADNLKYAKMKEIRVDKNRLAVIEWLNSFIKKYPNDKKGLYLHGNFGCGKTFLLVALLTELAKKRIKSAVVYWPEFLRSLKGSFETGFNERFDLIRTVPILLIDDIGAENVTDWGRDEILGSLLQYRMENNLITFFSSNFSLKELEEHLGQTKEKVSKIKARRIIERIKCLAKEQYLEGENKRN